MAFLFEERPCSVLLVLAPAEHGDLRPISDFQAIQACVSGVHDAVSNTGALTVAVKLLAGMSGVTRAMLQRLSAVCCRRGEAFATALHHRFTTVLHSQPVRQFPVMTKDVWKNQFVF